MHRKFLSGFFIHHRREGHELSILAEPTKIETLSEPEERKHCVYPRPAIRKGLTKISSIDEIDFSNPVVIEKLAAIHQFVLAKAS